MEDMMHRSRAFLLACAMTAAACGGPRPGDITELAGAARNGDATRIRALAAAGQDPNARDRGLNHWTPLLHAIHKGRRDSVEALIAAGANVNAGRPTPLMMAAGNGQADIVQRLLAAGADPQLHGQELLMIAVSGGALTDIENPLLGRCNTEVLRTLLQHSPGLRLADTMRTRMALWFARFNHCSEVLALASQGS
jgi:Ankyrin repeats (3 copies)